MEKNKELAIKELNEYHEICNGRDVPKVARYYLEWYSKWKYKIGWTAEDRKEFKNALNNFKNDDDFADFSPEDFIP
jgi:hypothetical protein